MNKRSKKIKSKKQAIKELKRLQKVDEEQKEKINNLKQGINEQQEKINELQEENNKLKENAEEIERVQDQQSIDIAGLVKVLNNLYDKKIPIENEYAKREDHYNRLEKIAQENPDLAEYINLSKGSAIKGMENARNSSNKIDEQVMKVKTLINELQEFNEFNY